MKLYEITENLKGLEKLADEGMDKDTIADTFEAVEGEFNDKAVAVIHVTKNIDSDIEAVDAEIKRLQARKSSMKSRKESVVEYLRYNMEETGITKIECPLFSITLAKGRDVVSIDDDNLIPTDYLDIKTTMTPMKREILASLKKGEEIPGASIVKSKSSLIIK